MSNVSFPSPPFFYHLLFFLIKKKKKKGRNLFSAFFLVYIMHIPSGCSNRETSVIIDKIKGLIFGKK
jgi:hypothetical protein